MTQSSTDPLLIDSKTFLAQLAEEIKRSDRYEHTFAVITIRPPGDIDEQEVLISAWFDSLVRRLVRGCDVVAVLKHEPAVAVLLPETDVSGAGALLGRIQSSVPNPDQWQFTLLEYPANSEQVSSFLSKAA